MGNIIQKSLDEFLSEPSSQYEHDNAEAEAEGGSEERGVLKSSFSTVRYDPNRNLGRFVFGNNFRPRTTILLLVTLPHALGAFPFFLALWNFIPQEFIYLNFLSWPLMVYIALTMNIDLALHQLPLEYRLLHISNLRVPGQSRDPRGVLHHHTWYVHNRGMYDPRPIL